MLASSGGSAAFPLFGTPYAYARPRRVSGVPHLVILCLVWIIPFVVTVVSIARDRAASRTAKAVWVLIALLLPLLGPILWFTIGRKSVRAG
jgi:hypothetical protein